MLNLTVDEHAKRLEKLETELVKLLAAGEYQSSPPPPPTIICRYMYMYMYIHVQYANCHSTHSDAEKAKKIKELETMVAKLESALQAHSLPPPIPPKGLPPSPPRGTQSTDGFIHTPQPPKHRPPLKHVVHHSHPGRAGTHHQNSHMVHHPPNHPSAHHQNSYKVHQPDLKHLGCHLLQSIRYH